MSTGEEAFRRIQASARSAAARTGSSAPTQEHLVRHVLESFLDRLPRTVHAEHVAAVVRDIATVDAPDGVVLDPGTITVQEIREQADCPGLRVRVRASTGSWAGRAVWDVSTGDPIVPAPRRVRIDRILGDPIELLGYAPETAIAEV